MDRGRIRSRVTGSPLAAPLAAHVRVPVQGPTRRPSRGSWVSGVQVGVTGLAAVGCVGATEPASGSGTPWALLAFLLAGVALYLVVSGVLVVASQRQRPLRRRRAGAEILVAVVAGSACGGLWILAVATVVNAATPQAISGPAVLGVGVAAALGTTILFLRCASLREIARLAVMTTGFHSLVLPVGALIAFLVRGAHWSPATSTRPTLTAVILGVRLAGDPGTLGLSVGGFLLGVFLVFIGDRVLRGGSASVSGRLVSRDEACD